MLRTSCRFAICLVLCSPLAACTADNPDFTGRPGPVGSQDGPSAPLDASGPSSGDGLFAGADLAVAPSNDGGPPPASDMTMPPPPGCGADKQACCNNGKCEAGGCCVTGICHGNQTSCGGNFGTCNKGSCQSNGSNCGGESQACCGGGIGSLGTCTAPSTVCVDANFKQTCQHCGMGGEPCCPGGSCDGQGCCVQTGFNGPSACVETGKSCSGGSKTDVCNKGSCGMCGAVGQPCCGSFPSAYCTAANALCDGNLMNARCQACGAKGQPCCANDVCFGGTSCQGFVNKTCQ